MQARQSYQCRYFHIDESNSPLYFLHYVEVLRLSIAWLGAHIESDFTNFDTYLIPINKARTVFLYKSKPHDLEEHRVIVRQNGQ